jgi:hypothetical protein
MSKKSASISNTRSRLLVYSIILLLVLFLAFTLYGKVIFNFLWKTHDFIGWFLGIVLPITMALYYQNRSFYLWFQRNFVLPLKVTHSTWNYSAIITTQTNDSYQKVKHSILEKFKGRTRLISDLANKMEFIVDEKTPYSLEIEHSDTKFLLTLKSGDFLVPSYKYTETLQDLVSTMGDMERVTDSKSDSNFFVTIKFAEKNPYFGFLLQCLPQDYIKDFRVSIALPKPEQTFINADKNNFTVNATNPIQLQKTVFDYLSFSPSISE